MLTALIAGNDLLSREGMAASVPWAALRAVLAGKAGDSEEALSLYRQYHPDLLILDIRIPGSAGLLRKIRAGDRHCAIILIADSITDEILKEADDDGNCEVLIRSCIKEGDLGAAAGRACAVLQPGHSPAAGTDQDRKTGAWRAFLFGSGCERLPFRAMGLTVFRLFSGRQMSPTLRQSLTEQAVQAAGPPEAYTRFEQDGCQVLVWKKPPEKGLPGAAGVLRDIRDDFRIQAGCVLIPEAPNGIRLPAVARRAAAMMQDARLFDNPVVLLDAQGRYVHSGLDRLRYEFAINEPFCRHRRDFMDLKAQLERYPDCPEEGLDSIAGRMQPLLRELGISQAPEGLEELTGRVCEAAGKRIREETPVLQPRIREVLGVIYTRMQDQLSREELSRSIHYDSAYFSRLFRQETGMNYVDYLFELRMLRAQALIRDAECSFGEIARTVGFQNTSYFFKRFRQFSGMTPSDWRKQVTKET